MHTRDPRSGNDRRRLFRARSTSQTPVLNVAVDMYGNSDIELKSHAGIAHIEGASDPLACPRAS